MSANCPYCPDEPGETPSTWEMSQSGWEEAKIIHDEKHTTKCDKCGERRIREGEIGTYYSPRVIG